MTLRRFAFNNVLRNGRIYAAYFLSSAFSVLVFFVYSMFALHPGLRGSSIHANVTLSMRFAEWVIYVFAFFFVLYSMSAFLKTRKREFGVLILHGMTNLQLRRMVFMENMLIGLGATLFGMGMGLVFSKLILLAAGSMLHLQDRLTFYWPWTALGLTFVAFALLFLTISLFTVSVLRGHALIDLLKGTARPKPEPKASVRLAWLAVLLLAGGYTVALIVKGTMVVAAMIPVTLVVSVGTYFLFTQLSVYGIRRARENRTFFWRRTNLLLFSDLAYRMKDNARTFFMVAILSAVAFSAIGSLVGFKSMYTDVMKEENPFAMEYHARAGNPEALERRHVIRIEEALDGEGAEYRVLLADIRYGALESGKPAAFVRASVFNVLAAAAGEKLVSVESDQAALIYYTNALSQNTPERIPVRFRSAGAPVELAPIEAVSSYTLPLYETYYAVGDALYERLAPATLPEKSERFYAFDVKGASGVLKDVGERLTEELRGDKASSEAAAGGAFTYFALDYELYLLDQQYGVVLFIGFFIGIVFFVGAGSFLYFRLYTDLEEDRRKFRAIRKLGLSDRELSSVLTRQIMLLFFAPVGVALVHGAVALTSLQGMFSYNLMRESAAVLGVFGLIQLGYFLLIRTRYIANVMRD